MRISTTIDPSSRADVAAIAQQWMDELAQRSQAGEPMDQVTQGLQDDLYRFAGTLRPEQLEPFQALFAEELGQLAAATNRRAEAVELSSANAELYWQKAGMALAALIIGGVFLWLLFGQ